MKIEKIFPTPDHTSIEQPDAFAKQQLQQISVLLAHTKWVYL